MDGTSNKDLQRTYDVSVIDSLDQFAGLSDIWNNLLSQSFTNNVFLTWEWMYAWSRIYLKYGRRLFVVKVVENGKVIAIAPWCIRINKNGISRVRQIEFLGIPEAGSDYLDVIVMRGREEDVSRVLYSYIFNEYIKNWDVLSLKEISSNSICMKFFINKFLFSGKHYEIEDGSYCPIVLLPKSVEEFDLTLSRNRRQQYHRHMKILEKNNDVERGHYNDRLLISKDILSIIKKLYLSRWGKEENDLFQFLAAFLQITEKDNLIDVDLLKINNDYVGGLLHFNYNNIKYMYLMAVNKNFNEQVSIGNILCVMNIKSAIEDKCIEYDFLKGEEAYKFRWMNHAKNSYNLVHYRSTLPALFLFFKKYLKALGKIILR